MANEKHCPFKRWLRKAFCPWPSVHNILLLLAMLYLLSLVHLTASEWASWVQAIGSIGAIWGALALGRRQLKNQASAKIDELEARSGAYLAVVESACKNSAILSELVSNGTNPTGLHMLWDNHLGELFRTNLNMLKTIPAHDLGSYELVVAHSVMVTKLIRIEASLLNLFKDQEEHKQLQSRWIEFQYGEITSDNEMIQESLVRFKDAHIAKIESARSRSLV
ncbi:hypothetical protein AEQ67_13620 [Pseudomonas sp. RIT-PI-q]|uniref:hypothetical protein n=1 Tax=Pseudomonas sp. RIT-PI-q TaxID=1690247 RepID=UPI0006CCA543|nr:hypothetical protein [Pseudomonas sp. RIT-PI-q]KPG98385.1 hypothetical protein AEQ67_13620 [Pseudomonas sp. RIT-PI-q]